jgi:hypothetical protein
MRTEETVSNLNFSPFSPDFSPRFLEKNPAHFCSGNFAGCAPGRSGNFDRSFSAGHTHVPLPGPRSKTDLLAQEHGIATGPLNRATFQSAALRAGILKLEDCTVPHMAVLIFCFVFRLLASSIRESSCVSVHPAQAGAVAHRPSTRQRARLRQYGSETPSELVTMLAHHPS